MSLSKSLKTGTLLTLAPITTPPQTKLQSQEESPSIIITRSEHKKHPKNNSEYILSTAKFLNNKFFDFTYYKKRPPYELKNLGGNK